MGERFDLGSLMRRAGIPEEPSERLGHCYEFAMRLVVTADQEGLDLQLIHGTIHNPFFSRDGPICHAWVDTGDGWRWDPTAAVHLPEPKFRKVYGTHEIVRYSATETIKQARRSGKPVPKSPNRHE